MRTWKRHIWLYEPLDDKGVVLVDYTKDGPFCCNRIFAHQVVELREGDGLDADGNPVGHPDGPLTLPFPRRSRSMGFLLGLATGVCLGIFASLVVRWFFG